MSAKTQDGFAAKFSQGTKIYQVYLVLSDRKWHCRECEYRHVGTTQIAGGSGIQGLQRGSKNRPGMEIQSENHLCRHCGRITRQDRWNGQFKESTMPGTMPKKFQKKVIELLGSRDVVENTERTASHLTIDHKLPMLRWDGETTKIQTRYDSMTDDDIRNTFQLLKKSNGSVSHNLLKSRACETCYKKGKRGTPFGISFFYSGARNWSANKHDPAGCYGCGWYDFDKWRTALNAKLRGV